MGGQTQILALTCSKQSRLYGALKCVVEESGVGGFVLSEKALPEAGVDQTKAEVIRARKQLSPDLIIGCFEGQSRNWLDAVFGALKAPGNETPFLAVVEIAEPEAICELLEMGAMDFVAPPLRAIDLLPRLWRLVRYRAYTDAETRAHKAKLGLKELVGESPAFMAAIRRIPAVANCDANVLITGETGTGKELCARAIHYLSQRSNKPFMPLNCGAIPLELVENELFGHNQGAYTDAHSSAPGLLRKADGGTVFLDEVDSLPLAAQVKLLRFLQARQFLPLGSGRICTADVRVVAACNSNLEELIRAGRFRQDLFYRLNVIPFQLPPLRERKEDIPLLARHFLAKYCEEFGKQTGVIAPGALQKLVAYDWPGNIRELENVMERSVVLSHRNVMHAEDIIILPPPPAARADTLASFKDSKARIVEQFERDYLQQVLFANDGNITKASRAAKKNRRAFWQLMRKHRLVLNADTPKQTPRTSFCLE